MREGKGEMEAAPPRDGKKGLNLSGPCYITLSMQIEVHREVVGKGTKPKRITSKEPAEETSRISHALAGMTRKGLRVECSR